MKAQVATAASCESRMLLKTISCIGRPQLGTGTVSQLLTNCPARPDYPRTVSSAELRFALARRSADIWFR
jgi:hypothetical protein